MAMLRRAEPEPGDDSPLPPEIAAGPDSRVWDQPRDWRAAGYAWACENLPPGRRHTWLELLPVDVRYAMSALGRAHAAHDETYVPPWDREDRS